MSWTTELAANLLAKKIQLVQRNLVAFPTSKPPSGCPGRIIPSMNSPFNSRVRERDALRELLTKIFILCLALGFWMLNSLALRWENTFLKGFYANCFCIGARDEPFCTAVAEGNDHLSYNRRKFALLPMPRLFSQKLCSSGCTPGASPRRGFHFWAWLDLSQQIPSVVGLLWRRGSGV